MDLLEIGKGIKTARKEKGITQTELSAATEISRATLSLLERGIINEVGIRKIIRLLDFLGLELSLRPRGAPPTLDELKRELEKEQS